ncbi:MAG: hypothetical protein DRN29_04900 [Thermoplasmata archaeon]|nr:MAG: hypothetical protein DRN29_04900 [Thermoplasmata archaeon]
MEFKTLDDLKRYLQLLEKHRHHPEDYVFGIEIEGALVDNEGKPLEVKELISHLNNIYQDFEFGGEAGACQLEIRSFPRNFSTEMLREKEEYLHDAIEDIVEVAEKVHKTDAIFLLLGANPHPEVLSDKWISNTTRAKTMAKWRSQFPSIKIANKKIRPEHIALAIQSIHIHIQGKGPDDVADKFNRLLYMVPEHIAISANSPVVGGEVVDYAEARLLLYEMADGGNAGLPKLRKYPVSIIEYGEYVSSFQPILAKSLTEMIKERHEDNRIRFEIPFRVENRVCPVQCTIRENMALIEYIIGRLKYAQRWSRRDYPTLKEIEINRLEAIKESIRGNFIWSGKSISIRDYLMENIEKAEKGLKSLDVQPRYLQILKRRIIRKKTPADVIRRWFRRGDDEKERIAYLVNRIWDHTRKNRPII